MTSLFARLWAYCTDLYLRRWVPDGCTMWVDSPSPPPRTRTLDLALAGQVRACFVDVSSAFHFSSSTTASLPLRAALPTMGHSSTACQSCPPGYRVYCIRTGRGRSGWAFPFADRRRGFLGRTDMPHVSQRIRFCGGQAAVMVVCAASRTVVLFGVEENTFKLPQLSSGKRQMHASTASTHGCPS